jgi:hypothetical protein
MTLTFVTDVVWYTLPSVGHAMSNWNHARKVNIAAENFSAAAYYAQKMATPLGAR